MDLKNIKGIETAKIASTSTTPAGGAAANSSTEKALGALKEARTEKLFALDSGAIGKIIKDLSDPDSEVRMNAAFAIEKLGLRAKSLVSNLKDAIKIEEINIVKRAMIDVLGELVAGDEKLSQETIPFFVELLNVPENQVPEAAVKSLTKIGSAAVPALIEAAKPTETSDIAAYSSISALGEISLKNEDCGEKIFPMLDEIIKKSFKDGDISAELAVHYAIEALGKAASKNKNIANKAIVIFKKVLEDENISKDNATVAAVKREAVESLGKIALGNNNLIEEIIPILKIAYKSNLSRVHQESIYALFEIAHKNKNNKAIKEEVLSIFKDLKGTYDAWRIEELNKE